MADQKLLTNFCDIWVVLPLAMLLRKLSMADAVHINQ